MQYFSLGEGRSSTPLHRLLLLLVGSCLTVIAQQPAKPVGTTAPFTLTVEKTPILNISLKAQKAKLSEIGEALAKELKTPVFLSPMMEKQLISVEFTQLTLEPALQLLAPEVYIDYEIDSSSTTPPKPLGIFFYGANQGEPPASSVVPSTTQSLLIEGDTEDGVEPKTEEQKKKVEEQPLKVVFKDNRLTVKAKKQPLPLVLLKIGEQMGIPVDVQYKSPDIVDTDLSKLPIEEVVRRLSPDIRLFLRADLSRSERRALRLVLIEPQRQSSRASDP